MDEKANKKKFSELLTSKQKMAHGKRLWLDKFAFYKIGTLLNSSPITDPIKAWQTQIEKREVEGRQDIAKISNHHKNKMNYLYDNFP